MESLDQVVLVTGATGFVAGWVIKNLLEGGRKVKGTVRSIKSEEKISHLIQLGKSYGDRLELVEADLLDSLSHWESVVRGCSLVCHTASPFPIANPKDEQVLIKPAKEGTLVVLRACANTPTVSRVVITSSVAAVCSGWENESQNKIFTEDDWSKEEGIMAYAKSKTVAERAAWEFVNNLPPERGLQLATVNPSFVIGPLLSTTGGEGSRTLLTRFLNNDLPGIPQLHLSVVDVRDVAETHVQALFRPEAAGHRFICSSDTSYWMSDIAEILAKEFTPKGYKITTTAIPSAVLWIVSWWDSDAAGVYPLLGIKTSLQNTKSKQQLGITFRDSRQSVIDMANSLIDFKLVNTPKK